MSRKTTTLTSRKTALARRISGNLYTVTYPGRAEMDPAVPFSYLRLLHGRGYKVTVDQSSHRGEGEPATYVVSDPE